MNSSLKKLAVFGLTLSCIGSIPSKTYTSEDQAWSFANAIGGAGSALSFAYWAEKMVKHGGLIIRPDAPIMFVGLDVIPRLVLDALCVGTSLRGDKNLTWFSKVINGICCAGSIYSLYFWGPAIIAHYNNPLFIARGMIDLLQIALTAKRVFGNNNEKTKE
jgi:hypothetical protein